MKAKSVMLALFLLTALCAFSQRIQVESGDTVAVVPIDKIRQANALFLQKDSLQAELDLSNRQNSILDSTLIIHQAIIQVQKDELDLQKKRVSLFLNAYKQCRQESKAEKRKAFLIGLGTGAILDVGIRLLSLIL